MSTCEHDQLHVIKRCGNIVAANACHCSFAYTIKTNHRLGKNEVSRELARSDHKIIISLQFHLHMHLSVLDLVRYSQSRTLLT